MDTVAGPHPCYPPKMYVGSVRTTSAKGREGGGGSLEDQAGTVIGRRRLECAGDLAEILPSDFAASLVSEEVR